MFLRKYGVLGSVAAVILGLGINYGLIAHATSPATLSPDSVTEVPLSLPPNGVDINHQAILKPIHIVGVMSRTEAIQTVAHYARIGPISPKALLVSFTAPQSIPPKGFHGAADIIRNVPAWVVTLSAPTPQQVAQGGALGAPASMLPTPVTHFNIAINALSGKFLLGFFTK